MYMGAMIDLMVDTVKKLKSDERGWRWGRRKASRGWMILMSRRSFF